MVISPQRISVINPASVSPPIIMKVASSPISRSCFKISPSVFEMVTRASSSGMWFSLRYSVTFFVSEIPVSITQVIPASQSRFRPYSHLFPSSELKYPGVNCWSGVMVIRFIPFCSAYSICLFVISFMLPQIMIILSVITGISTLRISNFRKSPSTDAKPAQPAMTPRHFCFIKSSVIFFICASLDASKIPISLPLPLS